MRFTSFANVLCFIYFVCLGLLGDIRARPANMPQRKEFSQSVIAS
jgi:hypothetical protein